MRAIRRIIVLAVTALGIAIVVAAVLLVPSDQNLRAHLTLVLVGVVLIEVAGWKRTNPFLPNERRYHDLRREVDGFVGLVRKLNRISSSGEPDETGDDASERDELIASLHASVDRMVRAAGRTREKDEDA